MTSLHLLLGGLGGFLRIVVLGILSPRRRGGSSCSYSGAELAFAFELVILVSVVFCQAEGVSSYLECAESSPWVVRIGVMLLSLFIGDRVFSLLYSADVVCYAH